MPSIMLVGNKKATARLKGLSLTGRSYLTVKVGYSADHAAMIHENTQMPHPNGGQAKYLEQPARELRQQQRAIVQRKLKQRRSLEDALLASGNFLLAESQKLVPVDTGELRDSGFVRVG